MSLRLIPPLTFQADKFTKPMLQRGADKVQTISLLSGLFAHSAKPRGLVVVSISTFFETEKQVI